jgi:SAM-dependent methyltransferase
LTGAATFPSRRDPLAGSAWSTPAIVAGFARSSPNEALLRFARRERRRLAYGRLLDVGCGAGRNAVPLALDGWDVVGTDLSWPMLRAAGRRVSREDPKGRVRFALAPMDRSPVPAGSIDLVVAHGIWNLARSGEEWRRAISEAARAARPGAALFVFTFSRHTLPPDAPPVEGERFVFTQFSGQPQCFVTEDELRSELLAFGFTPDPEVPLREHNRRHGRTLHAGGSPVIYEAVFRLTEPSARAA